MERLLSLGEVAEVLGISRTTAKIWASKRFFPIIKLGRLIRVSPSALEGWLEKMAKQDALSDARRIRVTPLRHRARVSFNEYLKGIKGRDCR
jgi:excisionase family DNA binding protein